MAGNAFITFFDKTEGESTAKGHDRGWTEVLDWSWDIAAETSWTKDGGASVGRPDPGQMTWSHRFDIASPVLMGYLCTGKAFPKAELHLIQATSVGVPETYLTMTMEGVFVTRVANSSSADGDAFQQVDMVFKTVKIDYRKQDPTGRLGPVKTFSWDIPAGTASPSA